MAHTEAALVSVSAPYSPSLLLLLLVSFFIPPCASSLILSPRVFHPSSSVVKATPPAWRWTGRPKVFHVCHKVSYTHTRPPKLTRWLSTVPVRNKTGQGYLPAAWFIRANRSVSLYRKFHSIGKKETGPKQHGETGRLFGMVECDVCNDRRLWDTYTQAHTERHNS